MTSIANDLLTVKDASEQLGVKQQFLRKLIRQGVVPFAIDFEGLWMLPQKAVDFLKEHRPRQTGQAGQRAAASMRELAAQLDPACLPRQRAWKKAHPVGQANPYAKKKEKEIRATKTTRKPKNQ